LKPAGLPGSSNAEQRNIVNPSRLRKALVFAVILAFAVSSAPAQSEAGFAAPKLLDLARFLPQAADLTGWSPQGSPQRYRGEDLFLYIDGGAEIYHEYGFKQVIARDYRDRKDRTITLEIYEMSSPESAFGMFTFKSSGRGSSESLGQDARLEDYYLNFWEGPCLVTIVGLDDSTESREGILQIARAAEAKMRLRGARPFLAETLPPEWKTSSRVVYLKGVLALNNIYPFFPGDVFRFREGIAAERDKGKMFILAYPSAEEARRRFGEAQKAFAKSPSFRNVKSAEPGVLEADDNKGNSLTVRIRGDRIEIAMTPLKTNK
jgi:hypothetical protein